MQCQLDKPAEPVVQEKAPTPFEKLTKKQQRIAIAKDVLAQLDARKIIAEAGRYAVRRTKWQYNQEAHTSEQVDDGCQACALGSLFVCAVELDGKPPGPRERGSIYGLPHTAYDSRQPVINKLLPYFSKTQLNLIESAYERHPYNGNGYKSRDAIAFGKRYDSNDYDDLRLRVIMQNIIDNDGRFIPTVPTT